MIFRFAPIARVFSCQKIREKGLCKYTRELNFTVSGQLPPVRVRIWIRVSFRVGGNCSRTKFHEYRGFTCLP